MTSLRLPPGRIVDGRFTIQSELGRGSTSVTYRAITAPNREVAIRLLDPSVPDAEGMAEALRRAHAALPDELERVVHRIVDGGRDDQSTAPFFVVPLVATPSLAQLVTLCPFEAADAAAMVFSLGRALDVMHARGVAHQALKPNNVFVGPAPDRVVRLTDPYAQLLRPNPERDLRWLAPEQVGKSPVGPPADVFAMALVAFHSSTGASLLTPAPELAAWRAQLTSGIVASARARELGITLPVEVDAVFQRALAWAPTERPPTASAFASALAQALAPDRAGAFATEGPRPPPLPSGTTARGMPPPPPYLVESLAAPRLETAAPPSVPDLFAPNEVAPVLAAPELFAAASLPVEDPTATGQAWRHEAPPFESPPLDGGPSSRRRMFAFGAGGLALALLVGVLAVQTVSRGKPVPPIVASTSAAASGLPAPAASIQPVSPRSTVAVEEPSQPTATATIAPSTSAAPAQLRAHEAELTVVCEPVSRAVVLIDGKPLTQYPGPAVIRAGAHGIGISRPGYGGQWQRAGAGERRAQVRPLHALAERAERAEATVPEFLRRCD